MNTKCNIDIYTLGQLTPEALIEIINKFTCCPCHVAIRDVNDTDNLKAAKLMKIEAFPSVIMNGALVKNKADTECCQATTPCCVSN